MFSLSLLLPFFSLSISVSLFSSLFFFSRETGQDLYLSIPRSPLLRVTSRDGPDIRPFFMSDRICKQVSGRISGGKYLAGSWYHNSYWDNSLKSRWTELLFLLSKKISDLTGYPVSGRALGPDFPNILSMPSCYYTASAWKMGMAALFLSINPLIDLSIIPPINLMY